MLNPGENNYLFLSKHGAIHFLHEQNCLFLTDSASLLLIASWMNEIQQSSHQQSFMLIKALSAVLSFVIHRSLPFLKNGYSES